MTTLLRDCLGPEFTRHLTAFTRHEVVRTGERQPIPGWVRWLVWLRDGETCRFCGNQTTMESFELDHIFPWSAGGCDCPQNLRVTCSVCNQRRSNFATMTDNPRTAVTRRCDQCRGDEGHDQPTIIAFCSSCGVVSRVASELAAGCATMRTVDPWWHLQRLTEDEL